MLLAAPSDASAMTTMPAGLDTNANTPDEVDALSTISTFATPLDEDERRLISPVLLLVPELLLLELGAALEDTSC